MRALLLTVLCCVGLVSEGATIKLITDYPNSPPVSSDFFLYQRGGTYFNTAESQLIESFLNDPTFTGGLTNLIFATNVNLTYITNNTLYTTNLFVNNSITTNSFITNLTVQLITNNTFITTNFTIQQPGGATNLNLTPLAVMYTDVNDAESSIPNASGILTNNGTGGIGFTTKIQFDEIDANLAYLTNLFTGFTNYGVLGTDGNGLLTVGSSTITNLTITNLTVVNLSAQTNFSTNLYFVSGKGNTLIITNTLFVTNGISALNLNPNQFVVSDANDKLVPTLNGTTLTNLNVQYTTNVSPSTAVLAFVNAYETNLTTDVTILGFTMGNAYYETLVYSCTNSGGSDKKVTFPNGVVGPPGSGTPPVLYCTNKLGCDMFVSHFGNRRTNCWKIDWAP